MLMAVVATCIIVSQGEKADAMFRSLLSRAGAMISSISSSTAIRGARASIASSGIRASSNPQSANTAPGSVVYDHTPGGSPVFITHPDGRRMYYGETDARVLAKELGSNVDPNVMYSMYYDADGNPVVKTTTSGKLLRRLVHSEIRVGNHEDHRTGSESQRIVLVGPWWVKGSDIKKVSTSTSKYPGDAEGGKTPGGPVLPSGGGASSSHGDQGEGDDFGSFQEAEDDTGSAQGGGVGIHGVSSEDLLVGKLLLKPAVIVDKTVLGGPVLTDNHGKILRRFYDPKNGSSSSSGGQEGVPAAPPLPVDQRNYSSYLGSETKPGDLQDMSRNLEPTIIKHKTGLGETRYELANGEEISFKGIVNSIDDVDDKNLSSRGSSLMVFSGSDTGGSTPGDPGLSGPGSSLMVFSGSNTGGSTPGGESFGSSFMVFSDQGTGFNTPTLVSNASVNGGSGTATPSEGDTEVQGGVTGLRIQVSGGGQYFEVGTHGGHEDGVSQTGIEGGLSLNVRDGVVRSKSESGASNGIYTSTLNIGRSEKEVTIGGQTSGGKTDKPLGNQVSSIHIETGKGVSLGMATGSSSTSSNTQNQNKGSIEVSSSIIYTGSDEVNQDGLGFSGIFHAKFVEDADDYFGD